jgi:hypothetical protein
MLRIFMLCKQDEYCRSLVVHIQILAWACKTRSPLWEVWQACQPALNEELCEQQLSSLARTVKGDTTGGKLEFTDKQFKLGALVSDLLYKLEPERITDEHNSRKKWRLFIKPDDDDLKLVELFFKNRILLLRSPRLFRSYTALSGWLSARHGSDTMEIVTRPSYLTKTSQDFLALCRRVKANAFGRWIEVDEAHWSKELPDEDGEPVPVAPVVGLDRAMDALVLPQDGSSEDEAPLQEEEPESEVEDFHDAKAVAQARQAEQHPLVVIFNDDKKGDDAPPPSQPGASSSSSERRPSKRKRSEQKHEVVDDIPPPSPVNRPLAPPVNEGKGEAPVQVAPPPPMEELDRLLSLAEEGGEQRQAAPPSAPRRSSRQSSRKPQGWHAEIGESMLWFSDEDKE